MTLNEFVLTGFMFLGACAVAAPLYIALICRKELRESLQFASKLQKDNPDEHSIFGAPEGWGTGKVIDIKARAGK